MCSHILDFPQVVMIQPVCNLQTCRTFARKTLKLLCLLEVPLSILKPVMQTVQYFWVEKTNMKFLC
jgi:hypothetical protein